MSDEHRGSPEGGFIRRLDPDWRKMVADVDDVQKELVEVKKSAHRQERYMVGGWAEDGVTWVPGVREKVDGLSGKFTVASTALWALFLIVAADVALKFFK